MKLAPVHRITTKVHQLIRMTTFCIIMTKRGGKGTPGREGRMRQQYGEREMDGNIAAGHNNIMEFDPFEIAEAKHEVKKKRRKLGRPLLIWEILEVHDRWISENLAEDKEEFDLINENRMLTEIIEPSSDLILPLMRYQKEWLAWAVKQEKSAVKGGILADEMGMGKTVQAIAVVLLKRMTSQGICGNELPSSSASCLVELPAIRGTLVICPLGAVGQWVSAIDSCTAKGSTKVLVYHGAHRAKSIHQVLEYDFVITTYSIVRSEYWKHVKCQWCKKLLDNCGCECGRKKNAMEAATNDSPIDDNPAAEQGAVMLKRKSILNSVKWEPLQSSKDTFFLVEKKCYQTNLKLWKLWERAADLALPPKIVVLRRDSLDAVEEDYYMALHKKSLAHLNAYAEAGILLNDYIHLLMPLRQAVNHAYLVEYSISLTKRKGEAADTSNNKMCESCDCPVEVPVVTACAHIFCKSCLNEFVDGMEQIPCPTCSKLLNVDFTMNTDSREQKSDTIKGFSSSSSILDRIDLDNFQTSTKIDALSEEIRFMVERDGSAKGIVFSHFSSFLDIISYALVKSGINCVQLDGSMSKEKRDEAITKFTDDHNCKIFLLRLKAGGVALNLTMASHVFLMEPWWNLAVEMQACDRIYGIGQCKPIRIVRFVIENTIEEKILEFQEKKQKMFDGTVGDSLEAMENLKMVHFIELFLAS